MELDVSNPLRTLLYYPEFSNIILLDRQLGKRAVIDLRKLGFFQTGIVAQAYDNGIWIHDLEQCQLIRINETGALQDRFTDFRKLFDSVPQPTVIFDQGSYLYLYDAKLGFYQFDHYGSFKKRIPFFDWKDVAIVNSIILGRKQNRLMRYDTRTLDLREFLLPSDWQECLQMVVSQEHIFVLFSDRLEMYRLPG
jgi:hypothetical protein